MKLAYQFKLLPTFNQRCRMSKWLDIEPTEVNSIGVDAGLEYFVACSDGTMVESPKFYRQAEEKLAKLQAKQELRKKGWAFASL